MKAAAFSDPSATLPDLRGLSNPKPPDRPKRGPFGLAPFVAFFGAVLRCGIPPRGMRRSLRVWAFSGGFQGCFSCDAPRRTEFNPQPLDGGNEAGGCGISRE